MTNHMFNNYIQLLMELLKKIKF